MNKTSNRLFGRVLAAITMVSFFLISQLGKGSFDSNILPSADWHIYDRNPLIDLEHASVEWVFKSISEEAVSGVIRAAIQDQEVWITTPEATVDDKYFLCIPMSLKKPSKSALAAFNEAENPASVFTAEFNYVEAARKGYWRAAARLVTLNLEQGYPSNVAPLVAWLIQNKVPAGYKLLADILSSHSNELKFEPSGLGTSLRWRAALSGDPDALLVMADLLTREGEPKFAKTLRDCAERNIKTFDESAESHWDSFLRWLR